MELVPELAGHINNERECVRWYMNLMRSKRITKNDHIMKKVADKYNSMNQSNYMTNTMAT